MAVITISLDDLCVVASGEFDPLAQGKIDVSTDSINLEDLQQELYFNDIGTRGTAVSKRNGRPLEEISESEARQLYATAQIALDKVKKQLAKSATQGGYGLRRDHLINLKGTLETITASKKNYFASMSIQKNDSSPEIDFTKSKPFTLINGLGGTYVYVVDYKKDLYGEKHEFTVKVKPTKRNGIYLFESKATLAGASEAFYTSKRYVDLGHQILTTQLTCEHEVLKYYTNQAIKSQGK